MSNFLIPRWRKRRMLLPSGSLTYVTYEYGVRLKYFHRRRHIKDDIVPRGRYIIFTHAKFKKVNGYKKIYVEKKNYHARFSQLYDCPFDNFDGNNNWKLFQDLKYAKICKNINHKSNTHIFLLFRFLQLLYYDKLLKICIK